MRCHYCFLNEFFQAIEAMGLNAHLDDDFFSDLVGFHGPHPEYVFVLMRYGLTLYPQIQDQYADMRNRHHDNFISCYENLYDDVQVVKYLMVLVSVRMVPRLGETSAIRVLPIDTFRSLKLMLFHHSPYLDVPEQMAEEEE